MNKKNYLWIMAIGCMNLLFFIPGLSQSDPLPSDPGRVSIDSNSYGYQVVNENGDILRGNAIWLWKSKISNNFSDIAYAFDSSYYQVLADSGVNTIRLALFDPWANSNTTNYSNVLDFSDQGELDWMLKYTDSVVNFASKYNMNVLINYHDVGKYKGEYGNPDANNMGYLKDLWTAIAPYYKDRTHVFYELMNEPAFGCSNFTNELFDSIVVLHDLVRTMAPETHLSLFSYTGTVGVYWDESTMYTAMQRFEQRYPDYINWNKASVAFHPYVSDNNRTSEPIVKTMEKYPIINTESNFPCDSAVHAKVINADKECMTLDNEVFINQTMERLGISWLQHKSNGWDHFNNNWPLILKDAREKGYIWFGDYNVYQINKTAENGYIMPLNDSLRAEANAMIDFTAYPDEGYRFVNWSGDISDSNKTTSVEMNAPVINLTAHFTPLDSFNVTVSAPNGFVRLSPSGGRYMDGTELNIWVIADLGYEFVRWEENDVLIDTLERQDIIVTKDLNLVAQFASTEGISDATANSQKITVNPNPVEGDNIHIALHIPVKDNVIIRIYDITGREVYVGTQTANEINIPITKLKGLKEGLIIIEVETDENIYRKKALIY